jgi:transcriptional regulator with XRE-family HTH domain
MNYTEQITINTRYYQLMDFSIWLNLELETRGWSRSEAARRGNVSASMFDKVINGQAKPGINFCRGVAKAFNLPVIEVFRRAGIGNTEDLGNKAEEIKELFSQLTTENQAHIRQQIQVLLEMQRRDDVRLSSKKK